MVKLIVSLVCLLKRSTKSDFADEVHREHTKQWNETDWSDIYLA